VKHYEVNFVDRTVETVGAEDTPLDSSWWRVTLLNLDAETQTKLVPHGTVIINLVNVTFIKEV
jgi:hypothetical protein